MVLSDAFHDLLNVNRERWFRRVVKKHASPIVPGFFDHYPRFLASSETAPALDRLNQRHRALIEANRSLIRGQRVLDLASHDGRWSFAAHQAGSEYVLGIEAREHLVRAARANADSYGASARQIEFRQGDVFAALGNLNPEFDTVFCFGFLYHTLDHMVLLRKIAQLQPKRVIIDTYVSRRRGALIEVETEGIDRESQGYTGEVGDPSLTVKGYPTRAALDIMLRLAGFPKIDYYDWPHSGVTRWADLEAYYLGSRVTLTAARV